MMSRWRSLRRLQAGQSGDFLTGACFGLASLAMTGGDALNLLSSSSQTAITVEFRGMSRRSWAICLISSMLMLLG
jgi:hypothetical protein